MHIIQERTSSVFEALIVAASHHNQAIVVREVGHRVSEPSNRRGTRYFKGNELSMNHLLVDSVGLEQPQSVGQNAFFILTSEVVNAFLNLIRFRHRNLALSSYSTAGSLDEGFNTVLDCQFHPLLEV